MRRAEKLLSKSGFKATTPYEILSLVLSSYSILSSPQTHAGLYENTIVERKGEGGGGEELVEGPEGYSHSHNQR